MHPVLIDYTFPWGSHLVIPSFGVCLATAYLVALNWGFSRSTRRGYNPELVHNMFMFLLIGAVGGARATYVWLEWDEFVDRPLDAFLIWKGGLVFYGGLIGGYITSCSYLWYQRQPMLPLCDLSVSCVAVGHMIGRVGCFLNGCCYGVECDLPWAVEFGGHAGDIPRHPTQIYEIIGLGIILLILEALYKRPHKQGMILSVYTILYAFERFTNEMVRGDDRGGEMVFNLSISQDIALVGVVAGLAMLVYSRWMPPWDMPIPAPRFPFEDGDSSLASAADAQGTTPRNSDTPRPGESQPSVKSSGKPGKKKSKKKGPRV